MATQTEQSDLVVQTVRGLSDLAESSYTTAKATLDSLASISAELPLSIVDTSIGTSTPINWTASISPTAPIKFPTFLETYLASLPSSVPTVPDVSVDLPSPPDNKPVLGGSPSDISIPEVSVPAAPTIPGLEGVGTAPVGPVVGELVPVPAQSEIPVAPVSGSLPVAPTQGTLPVVPTSGVLPLAPTQGTLPVVPASGLLPEAPTAGTLPVAPTAGDLPLVPTAGTVPEAPTSGALPVAPAPTTIQPITGLVPTIDIGVLDASFNYDEGVYEPLVKSEVLDELLRVLGGDLGIPQSHWDALWNKAGGDLALLQAGKLRNARNRGAASYWALPSEAVLSASKAAQDEGTKAIQINRWQQATAQATMAKDDFWKAVEQGIKFEQQWIGMYESAAARALSSAEQLLNSQVSVYNANVQGYNLLLERSKVAVSEAKANADALLQQYSTQVQAYSAETDAVTKVYSTDIQAYSSEADVVTKLFGADVQAYSAQTDAVNKTYSTQVQAYSAETDAVNKTFSTEVQAYASEADTVNKTYSTQVQAYSAETDAVNKTYSTQVQAYSSETDAVTRVFGANIQAYSAETDAVNKTFSTQVQAYSSETDAVTKVYGADVQAYSAEADARARYDDNALKVYGIGTDATLKQYATDVQYFGAQSDQFVKLRDSAVRAYQVEVEAALREYESALKGAGLEIEESKLQIQGYQAEWAARNSNNQNAIQLFAESVRSWSTEVDSDIKTQQLELSKSDTEAKVHATLFGAIGGIASAANSVIMGEVESAKLGLQGDSTVLDYDKARNAAEIERSKITQAAQEASVRIDVAQAQWLEGQNTSIQQRIAELSWGYAQATMAASDVNLGSSTSISTSPFVYNPSEGDAYWIPL